MDIFQLLSSVNFVSIFAFLGITGFLGYELFLFTRERRKKVKPAIPEFNPNTPTEALDKKNVVVKVAPPVAKKSSQGLLIGLFICTIAVVIGIALYGYFNGLNKPKQSVVPQSEVIIEEVKSKGVRLYSVDWKELKNQDILELKSGDAVTVGVSTVSGTDIDKARIRINEMVWDAKHITTQFNKQYKVYYREHIIGTDEARLKIDAQLHSSKDGWLGE